jgi:hypothetical protein
MTTSALVLITIVWTTVTLITGYFFYLVLTAPKHAEPDSFSENDEELN